MSEKLIDFDDYAEVKLTEYLFRLDRVPGAAMPCSTYQAPTYTEWLSAGEIETRGKIWPPLRIYIDLLIALNPERSKSIVQTMGSALFPEEVKTDFILELLKKHTEEAKELLERHIKEEQEKAIDSKQGENR
jgi:Mg/Co/Ni transporter MgtE